MKKLLLLISVIVILAGCGSVTNAVTDIVDPNVSIVRDGNFDDYPSATVGDAFQDFFANPKWSSFTSDTDETVVEFTGNCTFDGVEVEALIQFTVYEDTETFEVTYLSLNEVSQNMFMLSGLLEAVYEEY